jgi:hypothetical protein
MNVRKTLLVLGCTVASMANSSLAAPPELPGESLRPLVRPQPPAPAPATPTPAAAPAANPAGPKIQFADPVYDFGKSPANVPIKHTYIFTNAGDETLTLTSVQPLCGCTMAGEFTHDVPPGKTGTVPVQFNGVGSGLVHKMVNVNSNDKEHPLVALQITGTLWTPITLEPANAVLNVSPDSTAATNTIRIVNNTEEMLTLSEPESNQRGIAATLATRKPGKEFELTVRTVEPWATAGLAGQITLRTSSTNVPPIVVTAWVNVQQAVTYYPPVLNLPPGPLATPQMTPITIMNHSTNTLTLSEPVVSATDVVVQLVEPQPGKIFTATLSFPAGFTLPPGKPAEFTVKSNHPKFPLIRVPILQAQAVHPNNLPQGRPLPLTPRVLPPPAPIQPPAAPSAAAGPPPPPQPSQ